MVYEIRILFGFAGSFQVKMSLFQDLSYPQKDKEGKVRAEACTVDPQLFPKFAPRNFDVGVLFYWFGKAFMWRWFLTVNLETQHFRHLGADSTLVGGACGVLRLSLWTCGFKETETRKDSSSTSWNSWTLGVVTLFWEVPTCCNRKRTPCFVGSMPALLRSWISWTWPSLGSLRLHQHT